MLDRCRRPRPLAPNLVSVLVEEHLGVADTRVERAEIGRYQNAFCVVPGTAADPVASVDGRSPEDQERVLLDELERELSTGDR